MKYAVAPMLAIARHKAAPSGRSLRDTRSTNINEIKDDNRVSNLEAVTPAENIRRNLSNGRRPPWSDAQMWRGQPRITETQRVEMRNMRRDGALFREISDKFGVSTSHIYRLVGTEVER